MNTNLLKQHNVILSNCPKDKILRLLSECFNIPLNQYICINLQGIESQTINDFFDEISVKLKFPSYFGRNFNALEECLSDLDWLEFKGICIFIDDTDYFLCKESREVIEDIIEIFHVISQEWNKPVILGEQWDRDSVPCHFIFRKPSNTTQELNLPIF